MVDLEERGLTRKDAIVEARQFFAEKPEFVVILMTLMNRTQPELEWLVNASKFSSNFMDLPAFDESIEAPLKNIYHIIGETTRKNSLEEYKRVFPNQ